MRILVRDGPNLNLFGRREAQPLGWRSYTAAFRARVEILREAGK
jgi:3-dehydroquinate dehydratase